eukprot:366269-Chlamydomonas_euryale.AAC.12
MHRHNMRHGRISASFMAGLFKAVYVEAAEVPRLQLCMCPTFERKADLLRSEARDRAAAADGTGLWNHENAEQAPAPSSAALTPEHSAAELAPELCVAELGTQSRDVSHAAHGASDVEGDAHHTRTRARRTRAWRICGSAAHALLGRARSEV